MAIGISPGDQKVKVTKEDDCPAFLWDQLSAGLGIVLTILNPGADEVIEIKGDPFGSALFSHDCNLLFAKKADCSVELLVEC